MADGLIEIPGLGGLDPSDGLRRLSACSDGCSVDRSRYKNGVGALWLASSTLFAAAPNAPQEIARDLVAVQVRSCK